MKDVRIANSHQRFYLNKFYKYVYLKSDDDIAIILEKKPAKIVYIVGPKTKMTS